MAHGHQVVLPVLGGSTMDRSAGPAGLGSSIEKCTVMSASRRSGRPTFAFVPTPPEAMLFDQIVHRCGTVPASWDLAVPTLGELLVYTGPDGAENRFARIDRGT